MEKLVIAISLFYLVQLVHTKTIYYYPRFAGPDVIVFDGPTNYNETHDYTEERDDKENEIDGDLTDQIDLRRGNDEETTTAKEIPNPAIVYREEGGFVFPAD